ncbi:MAG: hypothetical protein KQJ78_13390 [Deltaproteobacteria bacterium]|nr:hypothetical protein [Deltaproteobacteria bacterium]
MQPNTSSTSFDIRKYLFVLRRRWVMAATVFLTVLALGLIYCLFWPPVYRAECLVVVQPQKVPGDIIKTTVTTRIEERLQIITQQVLSRTRLMEIIERFDLYPNMRGKITPDDLAELMRKDINITITRKNYFTISYLYPDPQTVAAVANALASFYVDSNLRLREEDAVGTARFLQREMERMRGQLQDWETKITSFKQEHLQELPESVQRNVALMEQLRDQVANLVQAIQKERDRIVYMEDQMATEQFRIQRLKLERIQTSRRYGGLGGGSDAEVGGDEVSPETLKNQIQQLLITYTPDHPDIIRLKQRLAMVEKQYAAKQAKLEEEAKKKGLSPDQIKKEKGMADLEIESARITLDRIAKNIAEAKQNVEDFDKQRKDTLAAMVQVQKRINDAPAVGEKLGELTRGYNELNEAYQNLNSKYLEASMSANLERTQRGEQFEVVDPAQVPDQPFRPNVARTIPVTMGLALVLSLGLAFGLSFIDTSFTSVEQTERLSALPVLVVMPWLPTTRETAKRRRLGLVLAGAYSTAFLILLALMGILVSGRGPALKNILLRVVT